MVGGGFGDEEGARSVRAGGVTAHPDVVTASHRVVEVDGRVDCAEGIVHTRVAPPGVVDDQGGILAADEVDAQQVEGSRRVVQAQVGGAGGKSRTAATKVGHIHVPAAGHADLKWIGDEAGIQILVPVIGRLAVVQAQDDGRV